MNVLTHALKFFLFFIIAGLLACGSKEVKPDPEDQGTNATKEEILKEENASEKQSQNNAVPQTTDSHDLDHKSKKDVSTKNNPEVTAEEESQTKKEQATTNAQNTDPKESSGSKESEQAEEIESSNHTTDSEASSLSHKTNESVESETSQDKSLPDYQTWIKTLEAIALESDELEPKKLLINAYLEFGTKAYLAAADQLLTELKALEGVDHAWVRLRQAELAYKIGEYKEASDLLRESYKDSIKHVPLEVTRVYFALPKQDDDEGFAKPRLVPGEGEKADHMYQPGEDMWVAFIFKYLGASYDPITEKYHYHLLVQAELIDEESGERVEEFQPEALNSNFPSKYPPEELETGKWPLRLPRDLKSERDYILRLTFTDLGKQPSLSVEREIKVKVRR